MPRSQSIQRSFKSGIVSKNCYGRTDEDFYNEGLEKCENFIPRPQGSLERRNGKENIEFLNGVTDGVSIPFLLNNGNSYSLVFTDDGKMRVMDRRGIYVNPSLPAAEIVLNPDLNNGVISYDVNTVVTSSLIGEKSDTTDTIPIYSIFTVLGGYLTFIAYEGGVRTVRDYFLDFDIPVGVENDLVNIRIIFDTLSPDSIVTLTFGSLLDGNENGTYTITNPGVFNTQIQLLGQTKIFLKIDQKWIIDPLNFLGKVNQTPSSSISYISMKSTVDLGTIYEFSHDYLKGEFKEIQYDTEPEGNAIWLVHEKHEPVRVTYTEGTKAFGLEKVITSGTLSAPPVLWSAGNYPGTIAFMDYRLWFGGSPNNNNMLWGSTVDNFFNFTTGVNKDVTSATPLQFTLTKAGHIFWLAAGTSLVIGTTNGEMTLSGGKAGDPIAADSARVKLESTYGSIRTNPITIGDQVLFVTSDGKRLRAMGYNDSSQSWVSLDLTFYADDITDNRTIVNIFYSQNPDHLIRCLMNDGTIAVCSYRVDQQTIGWHEETTPGDIVSASSTNYNGLSQTMYLVKRGVQDQISVELESPKDSIYLDNYRTQFNSVASKNISFPHLKNKSVSILADGAVQPGLILDSNGDGVIQTAAINVTAGLIYNSIAKTLPKENINTYNKTTLGFMKRFNKIFLQIINSAIPKINNERPPTRNPETPMDTGEPLVTQIVKIVNMGYDMNGQITIEQDLPFKCTISSIFGELNEEQL